jgi:predicted Rossmann fold nucleotide-binding protein DprA/Smf involved in DNA uptake
MKIQKELAKISKNLEKMSRRIQKLKSSLTREKNRAPKTSLPKSAAQKKGKKSGTQTVLDMIKKSQKGIDAGTLIKKTGFEDKKIRNILFKALTDGKIERVGRGVYKSSKG